MYDPRTLRALWNQSHTSFCRTHRERKEQYVKALEEEVVRLKEVYSGISQDKTKLAEENKKLKDLLLQHGIPFQSNAPDDPGAGGGGSHDGEPYNASGSGYSLPHGPQSQSGLSPGMTSHTTGGSISSAGPPTNQYTTGQQLRNLTQRVTAEKGVDYNQAGIDFVLTYDKPSPLRAYPSPPPTDSHLDVGTRLTAEEYTVSNDRV